MRCVDCGEDKPESEFYSYRRAGRKNIQRFKHCKSCATLRNARWRDSQGGSRWVRLKSRWGLTREDYERMLVVQGGMCAVCREREPDHVDHDHATGAVRGLLCRRCNVGLPMIENVEIRQRALEYLAAMNAAA